jgi:hypothetical protein
MQYLPLATESGCVAAEQFDGLAATLVQPGAQITGCRVLARVLPPLKRVVFAAAPPEIDLLCPIESNFIAARSRFYVNNHRKAHVLFDGLCRDVDSLPVQFCLSRGRRIFESQVLMKRGLMMQFSRRSFFRSRISQWTSPHDVRPTDHDMRQRQLPECFLATVKSGAPRHKHVQLEGQFRSLVHIHTLRV